MLDGFALSLRWWLLDPVWACGPAVDQSRKTHLHDGAVREVDSETIAADPHEELVGEHVLERGGQPDSGDHEVPADRGETLGVACGAVGDDPVANCLKLPRPERPLPVLTGEARNVPAEDDEDSKSSAAGPRVAVDKVAEPLLGSQIAKNDAVEELAFEGFWRWSVMDISV